MTPECISLDIRSKTNFQRRPPDLLTERGIHPLVLSPFRSRRPNPKTHSYGPEEKRSRDWIRRQEFTPGPFCFSASFRGETPRNFGECLHEISHRYSAKTLGAISKNVNSFLICGFTSQSTTMVMFRRSVNLTTLFLDRIPKWLTSIKCTSFRQ